ncbi:MAG: FliM/FliN family flagellar motor switch protein [Planctomycetales bacterium]|nr:FliM/FliN family flagellar motor switch protein [Planctomycetales bacterium]
MLETNSDSVATLDELLRQSDEALLESVAVRTGEVPHVSARFGHARPFELPEFSDTRDANEAVEINRADSSAIAVQIEIGRTELRGEQVTQLVAGAVVPLNRLAGDPVDIRAGGRLVARGEILIWNGKFCIRVVEVLTKAIRKEPVVPSSL